MMSLCRKGKSHQHGQMLYFFPPTTVARDNAFLLNICPSVNRMNPFVTMSQGDFLDPVALSCHGMADTIANSLHCVLFSLRMGLAGTILSLPCWNFSAVHTSILNSATIGRLHACIDSTTDVPRLNSHIFIQAERTDCQKLWELADLGEEGRRGGGEEEGSGPLGTTSYFSMFAAPVRKQTTFSTQRASAVRDMHSFYSRQPAEMVAQMKAYSR
jgi:hypothetical protein